MTTAISSEVYKESQEGAQFEVNIASVSDIHLGHPKNDAMFIIANLYQAFPNNAETGKLDFILIAGDLFDRALMLTNEAIEEIDAFIIYMLNLCHKYGITLIVLEGTPSHDRHQPKRIEYLNKITGIEANVIYVDELSVRYIEKLGHVLFVPDECRPTTEQILNDVTAIMADLELTKVDYAFMHGTFDYQVPAVARCPKHSSEIYSRLVDKLIFIGHDHTRSNHLNIYAQGSFDRICHNDEIAKGHYRAKVRSGTDYEVVFVENKNARTFVTVDVTAMDMESTNDKINEMVKTVRNLSFIRIRAQKGHPVLTSLSQYEKAWPFIHWSKIEDDDGQVEQEKDKIDVDYVSVQITPNNIVPLFLAAALNNDNVEDRIVHLAEKKLAALK